MLAGVPLVLKFLNFLKFHLCPEFVLKYEDVLKNGKNGLNCPDKLKNASECTKLNIDFQNFLRGVTPEPPFWREGEHT